MGRRRCFYKNELTDVFAPFQFIKQQAKPNSTRQIRFIDSIKEGLDQAMEKHNNLVLIGQDIAKYGGVFKITEGLMDKYGSSRVRNTPICESAIIGAGLGLSLGGFKSMVEMQFADFVSCGFNQIVNNLAKLHYRWGKKQIWSYDYLLVQGLRQVHFIPKRMKLGLRMFLV